MYWCCPCGKLSALAMLQVRLRILIVITEHRIRSLNFQIQLRQGIANHGQNNDLI